MPTRCASLLTTTTSETVMSSRRCKRYCRTSHMTWPARRRYFDDHRAEHRLSAAAVGHQNSHQRTPIDWYETKPIISTEQLCLCIQNRINVSRLVPLTEIPHCLQKEKKQLLNIFLFILGTSPFKGSQSGTWNNFGQVLFLASSSMNLTNDREIQTRFQNSFSPDVHPSPFTVAKSLHTKMWPFLASVC